MGETKNYKEVVLQRYNAEKTVVLIAINFKGTEIDVFVSKV